MAGRIRALSYYRSRTLAGHRKALRLGLCGQAMLLLLIAMSSTAGAQQIFDVAVIDDGPNDRLIDRNKIYVGELLTLTRPEFDVRIHPFSGDWSRSGIEAAIDEAYADPDGGQLPAGESLIEHKLEKGAQDHRPQNRQAQGTTRKRRCG